jgi:hypothetical protein
MRPNGPVTHILHVQADAPSALRTRRYPTSRQLQVKELTSLEGLVPSGQKKAPKVYTMATHPLQPHLVAVGSNTGDRPVLGPLESIRCCTAAVSTCYAQPRFASVPGGLCLH